MKLTDREQNIAMATIRLWTFNLKNGGFVPDYELANNPFQLEMEEMREIRDLVQTVQSPQTGAKA